MESECETHRVRVNVQSIRERFEARRTPPMAPNGDQMPTSSSLASASASNHNNHNGGGSVGGSNSSESDHSPTGFLQHNRISIKRSPAFRTGHKATAADQLVVINKKPSLKRKPGVERTAKPSLAGSPSPTLLSDPLLEEALKAPLPTGPAPKKPPRTFQHDAYIQNQQEQQQGWAGTSSDEPDGSPQRPARRKTAQQQRPVSIAIAPPYIMSRSKTEPFLPAGRKKSSHASTTEELPVVDDLIKKESRRLNPVQWNSFSPPSPARMVSASMLTICDTASAGDNEKVSPHPSSIEQPTSCRRMSCDFDGGRRRYERSANSAAVEFLKGPVSLGHVYDRPSLEGDLHYMCSPIMDVGDLNNWTNGHLRVTDDSDCESENDLKKSKLVEDRKIYVRRVSSNVCDLRKAASRPLTIAAEPGAGLFETFLVVGLYYDRQLHHHTPYIKSCYPNHSVVPPGVEHFCFPDSTHWPPPLQTASEPYTIVLTDSKGDRMYGYCRRVVPEGAQTCIPITYCLLSRHRAAGFYTKLLNLMVSRHGISESQRTALLDCLHKQPFPNPGRFVEFPAESPVPGANNKVNKVQRLLDGRLEDIDLRVLFERLNETVVLHVLGTMLLERKLIFISQNLSVLSLCIDAVQSMLYPFVWQHTLVPVLPHSMTEISAAPTPFILGILRKNVDDLKAIYPDQGMLVDLDSGKVLHSVGDESTILPRRSVRKLSADWEITVNITQQAETARNALYSESFLRMFVDLCGHYEHHVHCADSGQKYFERAVFARNHSNAGVRDFLEWFTETAMFQLLIESRLRHDAIQTLFEHKILEHSMHIVRPNAQLILPNSKILGRKIKTIGDKLREMNVFS